MLLGFAMSFAAWAEPPAEEVQPADVEAKAPAEVEKVSDPEATRRVAEELSRRFTASGASRHPLDRVALCRELVPLADEVSDATLVQLKAACPSWFPVPAPPTFCRIDPCVTDVAWVDGSNRTAKAPR
ncbi:MAG: hypothetical protein AAGA48_31190 [Myxococcota bacterium]